MNAPAAEEQTRKTQLLELVEALDEIDCIPATAFIFDYLESKKKLAAKTAAAELGDGKAATATIEKPVLEKIFDQSFRVCQLVQVANEIAERFNTSPDKEHMVAEILHHAVEESEAANTLAFEAMEAERCSSGEDGVSAADCLNKAETAEETQLEKWVQQALVASNMVRAARLIAEGLEVGDGAEELALTEVIRQAEEEVGKLFGSIVEARQAAEVGEPAAA